MRQNSYDTRRYVWIAFFNGEAYVVAGNLPTPSIADTRAAWPNDLFFPIA